MASASSLPDRTPRDSDVSIRLRPAQQLDALRQRRRVRGLQHDMAAGDEHPAQHRQHELRRGVEVFQYFGEHDQVEASLCRRALASVVQVERDVTPVKLGKAERPDIGIVQAERVRQIASADVQHGCVAVRTGGHAGRQRGFNASGMIARIVAGYRVDGRDGPDRSRHAGILRSPEPIGKQYLATAPTRPFPERR